jgi:hypothetical protein
MGFFQATFNPSLSEKGQNEKPDICYTRLFRINAWI